MKSELRFQLLGRRRSRSRRACLPATPFPRPHRKRLQARKALRRLRDTDARSAAMFTELGKVLTHPRCTNCHPAPIGRGKATRAGCTSRRSTRGADGHGLPAMRCSICHKHANFEPGRMPGHPEWHLAPREMAWEGKTRRRNLRAAQGSRPQWRAQARGTHPSYRRRYAGRLGLGSRRWPQPRARHAEAGRCAGRGLGENRRGLSRAVAFRRSCHRPGAVGDGQRAIHRNNARAQGYLTSPTARGTKT